MTTIKDIAKILVNRHHLKSNDAETFLLQMVEVINEGLLQDRQVKIKGFGTFKLQTVKERSSVNISTGERVTISEHDKITFTPDNVMRDLINKPFAQFETITIDSDTVVSELEQMNKKDEELEIMEDETTVDTSEPEDINEESVSVLTENAVTSTLYTADITNDAADDTVSAAEDAVKKVAEVSTEDIQETSTEEVEKENFIETEETIEPEHGTMADSPEEETDDAINTAVITEEIKDDDAIENLPKEESIEEKEEEENNVVEEEENKEEKEKVVENGDDEEDEEEDDDDEYEEGFFDTFSENAFNAHSLLLSAAVAALFFFLGYYCSQHGVFGNPVNTNAVDSSTIATQTPISQEQAVNANSDVAKMQTDSVVTKEKEESDKVGSKTDDDSNDDNMSEYNDDVRIRTGAYVIVGTEREVKVREGQTIKSISKANLGPDMECYVEAYNHTKTVKAGQVIKIPKLKLKKKRQK